MGEFFGGKNAVVFFGGDGFGDFCVIPCSGGEYVYLYIYICYICVFIFRFAAYFSFCFY